MYIQVDHTQNHYCKPNISCSGFTGLMLLCNPDPYNGIEIDITAISEHLVLYNYEINMVNKLGYTALYLAAIHGRKNVVTLLLRAGANITLYDPIPALIKMGNIEMIKMLINVGKLDVNNINAPFTRSYLQKACCVGNLEIVIYLVDQGADILRNEGDGYSSLYYAIHDENRHTRNHSAIVNYLLDKGYPVDHPSTNASTPLHCACIRNNIDIMYFLISRGAKPDFITVENKDRKFRVNPLLYLCSRKFCTKRIFEIIEFLLKNGANPNVTDAYDDEPANRIYTPLVWACLKNHVDIIKLLLKYGADPNLSTETHCPVLAAKSYGAMLELYNAGASLNVLDDDDRLPLHRACKTDDTELICFLVDKMDPILMGLCPQSPLYIYTKDKLMEEIDMDTMRMLIPKKTADIESQTWEVLSLLCEGCPPEAIYMCLDNLDVDYFRVFVYTNLLIEMCRINFDTYYKYIVRIIDNESINKRIKKYPDSSGISAFDMIHWSSEATFELFLRHLDLRKFGKCGYNVNSWTPKYIGIIMRRPYGAEWLQLNGLQEDKLVHDSGWLSFKKELDENVFAYISDPSLYPRAIDIYYKMVLAPGWHAMKLLDFVSKDKLAEMYIDGFFGRYDIITCWDFERVIKEMYKFWDTYLSITPVVIGCMNGCKCLGDSAADMPCSHSVPLDQHGLKRSDNLLKI